MTRTEGSLRKIVSPADANVRIAPQRGSYCRRPARIRPRFNRRAVLRRDRHRRRGQRDALGAPDHPPPRCASVGSEGYARVETDGPASQGGFPAREVTTRGAFHAADGRGQLLHFLRRLRDQPSCPASDAWRHPARKVHRTRTCARSRPSRWPGPGEPVHGLGRAGPPAAREAAGCPGRLSLHQIDDVTAVAIGARKRRPIRGKPLGAAGAA
jgi:hypothetical protein